MKIKVCGMKDCKQVNALDSIVDFIGFIFYEGSPRYVETTNPVRHAQKVGVFVDATLSFVKKNVVKHSLDFVQLHGNESPEYCRSIGKYVKVIKAFGILSKEDLQRTKDYAHVVNYLLFDTKTVNHGGSGRQFDWTILDDYTGTTPFILSGGICPKSLDTIQKLRHSQLAIIDLNSGFENAPANKNIEQLIPFIHAIKSTPIYTA